MADKLNEKYKELETKINQAITDLTAKLKNKGINIMGNKTLIELINLIPFKFKIPSALMPGGYYEHSSAKIGNLVLISGGHSSGYNKQNIYNNTNETFTQRINLKRDLNGHKAVGYLNGALISGGWAGNSYGIQAEQYYYNNDNNTLTDRLNMIYKNHYHSISKIDEFALISGGQEESGRYTLRTHRQWIYNLEKNFFTSRIDLPIGRERLGNVPLNGCFILSGGDLKDGLATDEQLLLNPQNNTLTTKTKMIDARGFHTVVPINGSECLISGGKTPRTDISGTITQRQFIYNLENNTTSNKRDLPTPTSQHTAENLGGVVLISGGVGGGSSNEKKQILYNINKDDFEK